MRHFISLLVVFYVFPQESFPFQEDSLNVVSYDERDFPGPSQTITGIEGEDNVLYFGNEVGVLVYDGSSWQLIQLPNFTMVYSLLAVGDRIYAGGDNEFGYFSRNLAGIHEYTSLKKGLQPDTLLDVIWQIKEHDGDIYFQTDPQLIRYDGNSLFEIKEKDVYIFNVGDKLIASPFSGGLYELSKSSFRMVNPGFQIGYDAAFSIVPLNESDSSYLIIVGEIDQGLFQYWPERNHEVQKWDSEASDFISRHNAYHAVRMDDDYIAIACFNYGVVIINTQGEIIRSIQVNNGLITNNVNELLYDSSGNLWISTVSGISKVEWSPNKDIYKAKTIVTEVTNGDKSLEFRENEVISLQKDNILKISFATPGLSVTDLEYSVKLEGKDNSWSEPSQVPYVEYPSLRGGDYTFNVKSKLVGGRELSSASLSFTVVIPLYQKWWVIPLLFVGLLGIGLVLYQYRLMNLKKLVNARTKEIRQQKTALEKTNKILQTANTELDNFVYRSSHDLIAPLKSVRGLINLTKLEPKNDNLEKYIDLMESSVLKLEDFIQNIMDYSINTKVSLEVKKVDLNFITKDLLDEIRFYPRFGEISIESNFEVPIINSDPKRLKIILSNFFTNAVKYHNFRDNPMVRISSRKNGDATIIEVTDNGPGVSKEHIPKVFDMFYRGHKDSRGSGLGLYIVKDSAEKLGGQVWVESEFGHGFSAFLELPN